MAESVRKALRVLDLFSTDRPDWGPSEVAAELGIAKSTAHGLLAELERAGLTERLPCGRHQLGWRAVGLARVKLSGSRLPALARPAVAQLAAAFGESAYVAARAGSGVVYLTQVQPAGAVTAPTRSSPAAGSPLWRVLFERRTDPPAAAVGSPGHDGAVVCAVAPVGRANAIALCTTSERAASRGDDYVRAVVGAADRLTRGVRS